MSQTYHCLLADRGVVRVTGDDAVQLLDGLLTNSLSRLDKTGAVHTGLLSPQGKILFDFFLVRHGADLFIDVAAAQAAELVKRLTMYRLRAKVAFEALGNDAVVAAIWGDPPAFQPAACLFADPRHAGLGWRAIGCKGDLASLPGAAVAEDAYHAHRIALGVPQAGLDYEVGDAFPHEAMYDQLGSVDFKKGCFVGQEVVSRMQHRGTSRKRVVRIESDGPLDSGAEVLAGGEKIGAMGSVSGSSGLALVRLDRAAAAHDKGETPQAGGRVVRLVKPDWANIDMATGAGAGTARAGDDRGRS